jgi:hypothetical protein
MRVGLSSCCIIGRLWAACLQRVQLVACRVQTVMVAAVTEPALVCAALRSLCACRCGPALHTHAVSRDCYSQQRISVSRHFTHIRLGVNTAAAAAAVCVCRPPLVVPLLAASRAASASEAAAAAA